MLSTWHGGKLAVGLVEEVNVRLGTRQGRILHSPSSAHSHTQPGGWVAGGIRLLVIIGHRMPRRRCTSTTSGKDNPGGKIPH